MICNVVLLLIASIFNLDNLLGESELAAFEKKWLETAKLFLNNIGNHAKVGKTWILVVIPSFFLISSFVLPMALLCYFFLSQYPKNDIPIGGLIVMVFTVVGLIESGLGNPSESSLLNVFARKPSPTTFKSRNLPVYSASKMPLEMCVTRTLLVGWTKTKDRILYLLDILLGPLKPIDKMYQKLFKVEIGKRNFVFAVVNAVLALPLIIAIATYAMLVNIVVFILLTLGVVVVAYLLILIILVFLMRRFSMAFILFIYWLLILSPSQGLKTIGQYTSQKSILKIGKYIISLVPLIILVMRLSKRL